MLALALLLAMPIGNVLAQPNRSGLLTDIPVTGELEDGGTFEGTLTVTELAFEEGTLLVSGVLNGTATPIDGDPTTITDQAFTTTAELVGQGPGQGQGSCQILFLDLGPIFLDLLGLQVDLSEITLDITAVPGPGNLLGNLLCGLAGLLDDGGPLSRIENLINRINDLL